MVKKIILTLGVVFLFLGCSDKETKKETNTSAPSKVGKIEVVQNDNFKEEKVQVKAKDENESKVFYYDYNNADKNMSQKEDKTYTPVDAIMRVRSPYEHVEISMLVSKLSKNFILKCSACHDDYANGIIGPSLMSKDASFIYGTIMKFKSGEKDNILMKELVTQMKDKEIKDIADEIFVFNQKIKALREKQK
ncbi:MAG: hypothetical protein KA253_03960 [Campylobacteraceae bacterium]|nr:hypothetical protein [Campylobacteraceae bacterium]